MDMARYGSILKHVQSSVNAVQQHTTQQQRRFVKPKSVSHVYSGQKCYRCHCKHAADACRFKNASIVTRSVTSQKPAAIEETRSQSFAAVRLLPTETRW